MNSLIQLALCGMIRYSSGFATICPRRLPTFENRRSSCRILSRPIFASPLDDFLGNIFGNEKDDNNAKSGIEKISADDSDEDMNDMSLSSFQQELAKRNEESDKASESVNDDTSDETEEDEFDGYALRDIIYAKYGQCFDVEFQRVDSYGFRTVYLVIIRFMIFKTIWISLSNLIISSHFSLEHYAFSAWEETFPP